jgi:hypothetical protein
LTGGLSRQQAHKLDESGINDRRLANIDFGL